MSRFVSLLASGVFALLAGCSGTPQEAQSPALEGSAWVLYSLGQRPLVPGHEVTLFFDAGSAQGGNGCNRYATSYTADGNGLSISAQAVSTLMACAPELMQQADAYTSALRSARAYRVRHGRLELLDAGGAVLAVFQPQSQELAGTSWRVTSLNNGKGAAVSVLEGSTLTLDFAAGGQASGSAGCNRYMARYEAEGSRLTVIAPAATRMMCADARVMDQEQAFLSALQSAVSMRIEGDRLELRREDGALALALERDAGR